MLKNVTVNWLSPAYIHIEAVSDHNGTVTIDSLWGEIYGIRPALDNPMFS